MVTCLCINVRAINETSPKPEARDVSETVIGRATNSFNMSIKAYGKGKANTAFPLEAGETVTIKASYTPFSAGVDFGLIDADGVFHYINVTNGSSDETIEIEERGKYTFAVRNNSIIATTFKSLPARIRVKRLSISPWIFPGIHIQLPQQEKSAFMRLVVTIH